MSSTGASVWCTPTARICWRITVASCSANAGSQVLASSARFLGAELLAPPMRVICPMPG